jgi:hypothetical protein
MSNEVNPCRRAAPTQHAAQADVALGDWDVLFGAVKTRLSQVQGLARAARMAPLACSEESDQMAVIVAECMTALDQLQRTVVHELGRRDQQSPPVDFDLQSLSALELGVQGGQPVTRANGT